jgi:hypothetical protein
VTFGKIWGKPPERKARYPASTPSGHHPVSIKGSATPNELVPLHEKLIDVTPFESSVAAGTDTIGFQHSLVTPAPHRIDVHIKKSGYLFGRQHSIHMVSDLVNFRTNRCLRLSVESLPHGNLPYPLAAYT